MQWNTSTSAGFSTNPHTWLPVASDYKQVNVEVEARDPESMLNWYKKLIALRRSNPALHEGGMSMLEPGNQNVVAWSRTAPSGEVVLVACSFAAQPQVVSLKHAASGSTNTARILAQTAGSRQNGTVDLNVVSLPPYGSIVVELK